MSSGTHIDLVPRVWILSLLILFGVAFYLMTPEERTRVIRALLAATRQGYEAAQGGTQREPFAGALRERTPWALVTPTLVALNVIVFVYMLFSAGALTDPKTLVGHGGNFGPRTTNGEWWRLMTAMFVHSGMLAFLASIAGLIQVGFIVERLVGPAAFVAVYLATGVFASLVSLSTGPVAVSVGGSGAIFGIYGLLLASSIWSLLSHSKLTIPLRILKMLGPAAGVFILYNAVTDDLGTAAELTGLVTGFISGVVLVRESADRTSSLHRVGATIGAAAVIVVAFGFMLRGIADVRPEVARVVAMETRTASVYATAVDQFRTRRISAGELAQLIDRTIMPELHAAEARVKALDGVPREHQPLVAGTEEYLRLRSDSWRLRAEGLQGMNTLSVRKSSSAAADESLRKSTLLKLRNAETAERASLKVLERIRPAEQ